MSDIKSFMVPPIGDQVKEVYVSDRFAEPFKIKVLTQEENEAIRKQSVKPKKKNGIIIGEELDSNKYSKLLIVGAVVWPDFHNAELCKFYGSLDATEVPSKMLSAGEYNKLSSAILEFNGFTNSEDEVETLEEEAKN